MIAAALFALLVQDPTPLPEWALRDPYSYERAQCSPLVRGDVPLGDCQARVRVELAAALGDALPPGLRPAALENCRPSDASGGVVCGPQRRSAASGPSLVEQDCSTRATSEGFSSECRPVGQDDDDGGGLKLRLWGGDD